MIEVMFGKRWPSVPLTNQERHDKWKPVYDVERNKEVGNYGTAIKNKGGRLLPPSKDNSLAG